MTRVMHKEAIHLVSSDVNFISGRFPDYQIGADGKIIEAEENPQVPSLKEVVAKETAQLLEQQKRLSVRDLADKFEKGLSAAAKLSDESKWREVASLDRHVLLKKLRDVLDQLRGRVAGRNKDDAEEAISMVEALAVQLTQREGELLHEKAEVKKLATFLKQAIEDAKKVIEEVRATARAEIESARAAVQRVEEALQEQEQTSRGAEKQELEELKKEIQEARRIKMLHQPSKVMDMEHELQALRVQIAEKSMHCIQLKKDLAMMKKLEENKSNLYDLEGSESLGSCLRIVPQMDPATDTSNCSIQWYRTEGGKKELISGATKMVYAPEPFDVGRFLQAEIVLNDERFTVTTTNPIDPAAGLGSYVEALVRKPETEFNFVAKGEIIERHAIRWSRFDGAACFSDPFVTCKSFSNEQVAELLTMMDFDDHLDSAGLNTLLQKSTPVFPVVAVVVTQMNGRDYSSQSIHVFHVGKTRIKLRKGRSTKAKETYSASMQLCGVRGGGNAAAQSIFWQAKKSISFILAFESERERNAVIMLARRFAFDCNVMLAGPDDRAPSGTSQN